jgi:orotidine-5'-phosphate decarboxylase
MTVKSQPEETQMAGTLIVALDFDTRAEAETLIARLGERVDFYKIGYQLFYGGDGLALGKALLAGGKRVFFDLKLLDIDNTVEKGVAAIAATGATMLTVHAYPQCMRAAVVGAAGSGLMLLGVSVLTSMSDADVAEAGFARDTAGLVALRAGQAKAAGVGGLVSSPLEAEMVRSIVGPEMAIVTPGIRPAGAARGDQKRVMGPREALEAGASHLVVGRPITAAPDPAESAEAILRDMAAEIRLA